MIIINDSNPNVVEEMFTGTTAYSCEYDSASCGVGN